MAETPKRMVSLSLNFLVHTTLIQPVLHGLIVGLPVYVKLVFRLLIRNVYRHG
jgi:hypothetical protein